MRVNCRYQAHVQALEKLISHSRVFRKHERLQLAAVSTVLREPGEIDMPPRIFK